MRQLREILRLSLQAHLSLRQIHTSLRVSLGSVQKVVSRAAELKLDWAVIVSLDDHQLARQFYPQADTTVSKAFEPPNWGRDIGVRAVMFRKINITALTLNALNAKCTYPIEP